MPRRAAQHELLFLVYVLLGEGRSAKRVSERAGFVGVTVSPKTVQRYSVKHHWADRLAEVEVKAQVETQRALVRSVAEMNVAQAQGGHALQAWAMENAAKLRETHVLLEARDLVAVHREGRETERMALGEATGRTEHVVLTLQTIIRELAVVFLAANDLSDAADRAREYASGSDAVLRRRAPELEEAPDAK